MASRDSINHRATTGQGKYTGTEGAVVEKLACGKLAGQPAGFRHYPRQAQAVKP
jgi:hypothetical protein